MEDFDLSKINFPGLPKKHHLEPDYNLIKYNEKNWFERNPLITIVVSSVISAMLGAIFQWLTGILPPLSSQ